MSQIDDMLATLGVRVVGQSTSGKNAPRADSESGEWFGARPGESLEFSAPDTDSVQSVLS